MFSIKQNRNNLFFAIIGISMFLIVGQLDYLDNMAQEKINKKYSALIVNQNNENEQGEYIANVCSGLWIDTEQLSPECPTLTEYKE